MLKIFNAGKIGCFNVGKIGEIVIGEGGLEFKLILIKIKNDDMRLGDDERIVYEM